MMTGITRVSKESVFSDLNNLNVITSTSLEYETSFGFTEEEVFTALDNMGMSEQKEIVKHGMMDSYLEIRKIFIIHGLLQTIWIKNRCVRTGQIQVRIV